MTSHLPAVGDAASQADRRWFQRNPTRTVRVRAFVVGELPTMDTPPAGDLIRCTVVRKINPDVRVRLPVWLPQLPKDTEAEALRVLARFAG